MLQELRRPAPFHWRLAPLEVLTLNTDAMLAKTGMHWLHEKWEWEGCGRISVVFKVQHLKIKEYVCILLLYSLYEMLIFMYFILQGELCINRT
jgi:hypothetical protein